MYLFFILPALRNGNVGIELLVLCLFVCLFACFFQLKFLLLAIHSAD